MSRKYNNILETVGNTPVVRINKLGPPGINLYAKLEAFNPMGSIKDRLALGVIEHAEKTGAIKPGQTVVEATSGNTGIGLAMVCAQKGYPLVVTMAENFSVERRKLMRFLGVKVVLTPAAEKGTGMLNKAKELAEKHGWFLCRQFENEANADMHSKTTAPEILAAFPDESLDYWVTGYGTGGTLKGVARILREKSPKTKIVVCEPDNSGLLGSGELQERDDKGSPSSSHPVFRPHLMQGWTPDFISRLTEDAQQSGFIDQILAIDGQESLRLSRELAQKEGIFTGITAGATFSGALRIAAESPPGTTILCMLPDTGERYLTTPLFEDILEEMSAEEIAYSQSTPGYRFDITSNTAPPASIKEEVDREAEQFVKNTLEDVQQPVVMFALEWCEFCWSVRKMLGKFEIDYRAVDLDSVAYQENNWGGKIRTALKVKTGSPTIPQIFVGGHFIGGCTELFDAFNTGELQKLLKQSKVSFDEELQLNPYSLLPAWLQPR